ncbi:CheR family methyltransferase [Novosphingobium sp.]|uniref:CheR family methyltransferase n=1 Tax=Novosphingobium sp. TaxID=1874826 RepID=UPI002FDD3705
MPHRQAAQDCAAGDDTISPLRFRRIASFIEAQTGIRMPESKVHLIQGRLLRRVREEGFTTIDAYCDHILSGEADAQALVEFINAVTTNKTDFFREPGHFEYLRSTVLPALRSEGRRHIRCWSAAASTGMEAYTLAIVLADFIDGRGDQDFSILATDIDTRVLEEARRGIYPVEAIAPVPPQQRTRYFAMARDPRRREARVVPALRQKLAFARVNLMDARYPVEEAMDLIFCRNVLIYFDKAAQAAVVARLATHLRPGGHLVLGHSETIHGMDLPLQSVSNTVFRKTG